MKKDILYVFGGEKAQGAEIVIERLMNYNNANVNVHLFISPGKFADSLIASHKPYRISCLQSLRKLNRSKISRFAFYVNAVANYLSISYRVYRYIKANKIYTIHANTIVPASYLLPLIFFSKLFLPNRKWLWSDHDMNYFSRLDLVLAKWCMRLYDHTLVVSEAVTRKYPASHKIMILYNGLERDLFKPNDILRGNFRSQLNIPSEKMVLGIAASICPGKGQLPLILSFKKLTQSQPDMLLLIAGTYADDDIDYNEQVRMAIDTDPRIVYLGFVENMLAFYNGCDIIVSNSDLLRSESLGTTIYEAMSCGKIVIASDTGGTPEIIDDQRDGLLFKTNDNSDLLGKMEYATLHYQTLYNLRSAARNKVRERFDIFGMVEKYNLILQDIYPMVNK